jgi:outer membrane protein
MRRIIYSIIVGLVLSTPLLVKAQSQKDTILDQATLPACVQYALVHYPLVQQSLIDERITEHQIKSALSQLYPQLNLNYSDQYIFQFAPVFFNGEVIQSGTHNNSGVGFSATQNIFNRDVLLATQTRGSLERQSRQTTAANKIDIVVNVSKAFYDVLLTQKQIEVLDEDIVRLERSLKDAYNQYKGGLVDKIDYKRATISLNNSKAQKRAAQETLKAKNAVLKQQMGYLNKNDFTLNYDSTQLVSDAMIDTSREINYSSRIEYQLLQTRKSLQEANLRYYKLSYIPDIQAFGTYNVGGFYSNNFAKLYGSGYSNSYVGVQFTFPIFQGGKRIQDIKVAELQVKRVDWDIISLKTEINTEYVSSLATYKSNLSNYLILKDNYDLALDVYNTLQVQYKQGIKAYLDVITGETDLRTAQFNYTNALYQVLSSKYDVERALGAIQF